MNCEDLAGLGRVKKEIEPFTGLKVSFHSLTVKEEREINQAMAQVPQELLTRMTVLQIETLVRSIENIGGKTFTDPSALREYLENLQRHTLTILWDCWSKNFDQASLKDIEGLKKNSELPVPA